MKKFTYLLLIFWLPLFFSAASFASTSMQLNEAFSIHSQQPQQKDHCKSMTAAKHCKQCNTAHDKCAYCGSCASIVFSLPIIAVPGITSNHELSSHIAWVSSPHLIPPEQRPPISL